MTRLGSAASFAAAEAEHVRVVIFAELKFDSGTVRASTADRSIFFDPDGAGSPIGEEFLGLGNFAGVSTINETAELRPTVVELVLTGIPEEFIALAFEKSQGRQGRIWVGFFDDNYQLIIDPVLVFKGLMDNSTVLLGDTGTVTIPLNNRLIEWQRPRIIRYTNEDQQNIFGGDLFFEFVQQTVEKDLLWGVGSTNQVPVATPPTITEVVQAAFDTPGSSIITTPDITPQAVSEESGGTQVLVPFGQGDEGGIIRGSGPGGGGN